MSNGRFGYSGTVRFTRRAALLGPLAALLLPAGAAAKKKKKKPRRQKEPSGPLGVLAGTVFTSNGRSLPGAAVTVVNEQNPKIGDKASSDARGEFAFRLPAGAGPYIVRAEAKGFQPQEKKAEVYDSQKTNLNLLLEPE